ncbi:transmembrane protease serine 9 isoform X1 [Drosophila ficusphila]|uniref:transmembrane protease serine 9 isoform X1 n=2 Tax=Drosophila ficusphila TaxID=30025 RepID=UPI001C896E8F|nr:transmembrane protease serine 9 isoform X1 [Drosophila ficusphila]XP_043064280.1 transmembrane protease serine 9 isoform X1 [Drosophila ficusphila]XP_043064281.1 transmembrane protease serine 9 isoform X1 [Drosophila ficusphila]XP_043064282.1 transmembrane protease serine 9 isoform X1 [Drosophila ficusphila]XP_043064283.1 transmembrane protease serine 9 isoform X1 [Drosophila ficusphila]XP_043064284.1 transmembrane protease serine 9 isoform X1 [Drosophila ficusphila]
MKNAVENAVTFTAVGWELRRDGKESSILQSITLDHLNRSVCHNYLVVNVNEKQICAGDINGGDTCRGDSGGPLSNQFNFYEHGIREVQLGIVSYGSVRCDGPGVNVDVTSYVDWIQKAISEHEFDSPESHQIPTQSNYSENIMLYNDCGGKNVASNLLAKIWGPNFEAQGALITDRFVVTVSRDLPYSVNVGVMQKNLDFEEYIVENVFKHPDERSNIALIKLNVPVNIALIHPICVVLDKQGMKNALENAVTFTAVGWGWRRDGKESSILQNITLDHLNRSVCHNYLLVNVNEKQICAGDINGGDTCRGDSGGPLSKQFNFYEHGIREVQLGIVSYGREHCDGPGVNVDVTSYVDWIQETIRKFEFDEPEPPQIPTQPNYSENIMLYNDCNGATIASNLLAKIWGPNFVARGVLITDRFVVTVSRGLPDNPYSLEVGVMQTNLDFADHRVEKVFKHPDESSNIALIKLNRPVTNTDGMKPICMVTSPYYQQAAASLQFFTAFGYVKQWNHIQTYKLNIERIRTVECANTFNRVIQANEFCTRSSETPYNDGVPGFIFGKELDQPGRQLFVLLGIVSYSFNGLHVATNILPYTNWISHIVTFN